MSWDDDWMELKNGDRVRREQVNHYSKRKDIVAYQLYGDSHMRYTDETIEEFDKAMGRVSENVETLEEDQIFRDHFAKEAMRLWHLACPKCFGKGWTSTTLGNEACTRCVGSGVDNW